jgi:uncharacterized membrane protein
VPGVVETLTPFASASLRYLPTLVLVWLAVFFGRTLRTGAVPLIERVARIAKPSLSAPLCRYTRALTAVWSGYFVVAAISAALAGWRFEQVSIAVASVSAVLFVGEHWIRRIIFLGEWFPGLTQQVRDTIQVWRPGARAQAER